MAPHRLTSRHAARGFRNRSCLTCIVEFNGQETESTSPPRLAGKARGTYRTLACRATASQLMWDFVAQRLVEATLHACGQGCPNLHACGAGGNRTLFSDFAFRLLEPQKTSSAAISRCPPVSLRDQI